MECVQITSVIVREHGGVVIVDWICVQKDVARIYVGVNVKRTDAIVNLDIQVNPAVSTELISLETSE
jgi:hypothetical protein